MLRAIEAIERSVEREEPVLDIGSVGSAIPPALGRLGYRDIQGIDLDPRVRALEGIEGAHYSVGDFTAESWPRDHFGAVTAISVIEHGVPEDGLFAQLEQILKPGGLFLFSTDYWPEKMTRPTLSSSACPGRFSTQMRSGRSLSGRGAMVSRLWPNQPI